MLPDHPSHQEAIVATRHWLERAVIGLNLCPFAKGVQQGAGALRGQRCD